VCKCVSNKFHVGTNNKFAMCSVCKTAYNDKGEEVEIKKFEGYKVDVKLEIGGVNNDK
jgi:hypothetical protein